MSRSRALQLLVVSLGTACSAPPGPCDGGECPPPPAFCDAGTVLDTSGSCTAIGWTTCPTGFTADPSGWGCQPIIAAARCDAGTMPRLGQADCAPVGWLTCTLGFARDDGGWGCDAVVPTLQRDGGAACTGATRESLGAQSCVPVGDCSDAGFPPAAATVFVDDSFAVVDATHFRTISAAMTAAAPGATIAIESGLYREALAPNRPLNLVGRCPATVRLTTDGGAAAVTAVGALDLGLDGLTISGALIAVRAENGARVTGKRLVLEGNRRSGVQAIDGDTRVTLEESIVRATQPDPATMTFGQGIAASFGAQLTLTDVALVGNHEAAIFIDRVATHLEGTRLVIQSTRPRTSNGRLGWGLAVQGGATADLHGAALIQNTAAGLLVSQTGSRATLTDFVVRGTKLGKDNTGADIAVSASAQAGARLQLTSGALLDSSHQALNVEGTGTQATATNVVIRGLSSAVTSARAISIASGATATLSHVAIARVSSPGLEVLGGTAALDEVVLSELGGVGVRAQNGGSISGSHVSVDRATGSGVLSIDANSRVQLTDCAVIDTRPGAAATGGQVGYGAISQDGANALFDRCVFDRNVAAGLYAAGGTLSATSAVVRDTRADPAGEYGQGVVSERGGSVDLHEVLLDKNRVSGLQVANAPSSILAIGTLVRDTQPDAAGKRGRGANAQFGGTLLANLCAFLGNRQVGVFAFQSKVTLDTVLVRGTLADPDGAYGNGIEALTDGDIAMTGGAIDSSAGIGAVFAEGAGLLDAVRVLNNAVGVHTQDGAMLLEVDAPPAMRGAREVAITRSTVFDGNATKLGTGQVAVPMP